MTIKKLIMDIDGSLTDGKIYMGSDGEAMKAFSIKDGYAINYILKQANIQPIVITARTSEIVLRRCKEIGISDVYQGRLDKLSVLLEIVEKPKLGECAYFGDDVIDLECMMPIKNSGGIVGCPADAVREVKAIADYVCVNKAGEGALREFAEWLVQSPAESATVNSRIKYALSYLKGIDCARESIGVKRVVDENFYYSLTQYETRPESECRLESHRKYVDIQIMVEGQEAMDIADTSRLTASEDYNDEKDLLYWNVPEKMLRITMRAGDYAILFPENAHRGAICIGDCQPVLKIVGKVKIN